MRFSINPHNMLQLQGNVVRVKEYSPNKAASITIAVHNGKDEDGNENAPHFIQLKSFSPAAYNSVRAGMKVRVYGHILPNRYEKNGETVYSTDLIVENIDILESKAAVRAREERKNQEMLQA